MKKLLIMTIMIMFTVPNAQAVVVNYSPTGQVSSFGTGTGFGSGRMYNNNVNNFGSNASFLPQNIQRETIRQRQIENEKQYLESLKNTQNINVNVNHNGIPMNGYRISPYSRYYNGGYYNNGYYNNGYYRYNGGYGYVPGGVYYNNGNGVTIPGIRMY